MIDELRCLKPLTPFNSLSFFILPRFPVHLSLPMFQALVEFTAVDVPIFELATAMHFSIQKFSNIADLAFCQRTKTTAFPVVELTIIDVPLMIDMDPRPMKLVHMELPRVLFIFICSTLYYQLPFTLFFVFIKNSLKVICPIY